MRTRETLSHLAEAYYRAGDLRSAALCYQKLGREGLAVTLAALAGLKLMQLYSRKVRGELAWITADPAPVIRAEINNNEANLILDTRAGDSVLDMRFAVTVRIRIGGQETRHFAGGQSAQVTHGHAEQLKLGDIYIQDVPFELLHLQAVFGDWDPELEIHGILGIRAMSLFSCTLDFQAGLLRLDPPEFH